MSVKTLYRHLKLHRYSIRVPLQQTVPSSFIRPCLENHRLQSRKQCFAKENGLMEKNRPTCEHVVECLKRFVIVARDESPGMEDETEEREEEEEEVTSAEVCECKSLSTLMCWSP
ncbi:hypothetical protein NPIL_132231 [Nephila pilipes]|uniref:Uncharacterized protein n=1 Tax=Nephila pilipes TaxID=299642 RepID=A0A8X6P9X8_NEPPI|nr:hypothetical protein NPIL_132231 [Nephila pilipes]